MGLGRRRGGGESLGQHSNCRGIGELVRRRRRASSQVGGFGDRKV